MAFQPDTTPLDWWEHAPRERWQDIYEDEQPKLAARTPRFIAVFLDNEQANYGRRGVLQPKRLARDGDF